MVTQRTAEEEDPGAADLYTVGTVARIVKLLKMGEDNYSLVVQGLARFRVLELVQETPYLKARIEPVEDKTAVDDVEVEALAINLKKLAREVIELMPELPGGGHRAGRVASPTPATSPTSSPPTSTCPSRRSSRSSRRSTSRRA